MRKLLVVYSSGEGQTARIAQHTLEVARAALFEVKLCDVARFGPEQSLAEYDGVLVGGSIHHGKHMPALVQFVVDHRAELQSRPTAFFSVSLSAAGNDEQKSDARRCLQEFIDATQWEPDMTTIVAGAVLYREYGMFKRFVMKRIMGRVGSDTDTSRNYEYTDWDQVESFTADFLQHVITQTVAEEVLG